MGRIRGHYVDGIWAGDPGAQTARSRRGGHYRAFVPDPVAELELALPGDVAATLESATGAIRELNASPPKLATVEAVARHLLRQESLASSRIEGLVVGHRRIALADFDLQASHDHKAADIVGNIHAMRHAIELGASTKMFAPDDVLAIHRTLLRFGEDEPIAGRWREEQGWVGGVQPTHATYVPPPHTEVPRLMEDLSAFMNREDLPALAHAAIAHAQFENIHPFADGNGRVGRCLIHALLRRRELCPSFVPPISVVLAARRDHYFAGLEEFRGEGLYRWVEFFARLAGTAAREAQRLSAIIDGLEGDWLDRFPRPPRVDATSRKVLAMLPAHPVLDVPVVMHELDVSDRAAGGALNELEALDIVRLVARRTRDRVWECPALFEAMTEFERMLATA